MSTPLSESLKAAWDRRQSHFKNGQTTAYRLLGASEENLRGLSADRYEDIVILYRPLGKRVLSEEVVSEVADFYLNQPGIASVYLKDVTVDRSHAQPTAATLLSGNPISEEKIVKENGLAYKVAPLEGFSSGLFMDQREQRLAFQKQAAGIEVLNTFAYTCSFSVACAKGGAKVTSVDISKRYLDWGKDNFVANSLDPENHEFFPNDTMGFLKGAAKRGRHFDLVILDPPSFARNKKGTFSIRRDAPELLSLAAQVVKPGGLLYFSSNLSELNNDSLSRLIRITLPSARIIGAAPLPVDFQFETNPVSRVLAVINGGRR
ncbi:MAG: class I SAM-dependent methyltransferase [Bdellovibrionota bacterium]